jgi:hypothetical protein
VLLAVATLALVATMAGAAEAATKPFVAKLKDTVCTHSGAFFGHGTHDTLAQMTENGRNGTNYMVIKGKFQRRGGGSWQTLAGFGPYTSATFRDGAASHTHSQPYAWAFRDIDVGGTFRWLVTFEWWDQRSGPDRKIESRKRTTAPCTA